MRFFLVTDNMHNSACYRPSLEARQSQSCIFLQIITMTKQKTTGSLPAVADSAAGAPGNVIITLVQLARAREALRDWLASGKDALSVTNRSLDNGVLAVVSSLGLPLEVPAASSDIKMHKDRG